ncbi:MAG TPA: hypothetical protein VFU82_01765 [Gammaproteobacteria bacterium]|nr:hypothetical protein [Gammaproteobacteria bacterium]
MNNRHAAETQRLFKPRQDIDFINIQNALDQLSAVNQHAFESLATHCKNNNSHMSEPVIRFISQLTPLLCSHTGQVPPLVQKLILQAIKHNDSNPSLNQG